MKTQKFQIIRFYNGEQQSFVRGEKQTFYSLVYMGDQFEENGRNYTFSHKKEAETTHRPGKGYRTYPVKFVYTYELGEGRFVMAASRWDGEFEDTLENARQLFRRVAKNCRRTSVCTLPKLHVIS